MNANLFAGFSAFETPSVPEGSLQVVYGLSVDTVQIAGEASVASAEDLTPADLAAKLAAKFNMPVEGLRVFVDGKEVNFNAPIPANARNLEFRQPSGEKGAIILPMRDADAFTVTTVALDIHEIYRPYRKVVGTIDSGFLTSLKLPAGIETVELNNGQVELVQTGNDLVETKVEPRFVDCVRRTGAIILADLAKGLNVVGITVNGVVTEMTHRLAAGDTCIIYVAGEKTRQDLVENSKIDKVKEEIRRAELELKKVSELQAALKVASGRGAFGKSKAQLIELVLKAEGLD